MIIFMWSTIQTSHRSTLRTTQQTISSMRLSRFPQRVFHQCQKVLISKRTGLETIPSFNPKHPRFTGELIQQPLTVTEASPEAEVQIYQPQHDICLALVKTPCQTSYPNCQFLVKAVMKRHFKIPQPLSYQTSTKIMLYKEILPAIAMAEQGPRLLLYSSMKNVHLVEHLPISGLPVQAALLQYLLGPLTALVAASLTVKHLHYPRR